MVEWDKQRKKSLVPRKNKKKHTWAPSVNATTMIYYCEKFYEIKTGITKQKSVALWLGKLILKNSEGKPQKNGGQVRNKHNLEFKLYDTLHKKALK